MSAKDLDYDMLRAAALLMEQQGGSFANHIARAFFVADVSNTERLVVAFDDMFTKFYRQHCLNQRIQEADDQAARDFENYQGKPSQYRNQGETK